MGKTLHRSRTNRVLFGVCGGLGEYFDIDPTIVRLICVIASIFGGTGIVVYIVAAFIMPEESKESAGSGYGDAESFGSDREDWRDTSWNNRPRYDVEKSTMIIGAVLVLTGILFLAKQFFNFNLSQLWPLILIGLGVALLYRGRRN